MLGNCVFASMMYDVDASISLAAWVHSPCIFARAGREDDCLPLRGDHHERPLPGPAARHQALLRQHHVLRVQPRGGLCQPAEEAPSQM